MDPYHFDLYLKTLVEALHQMNIAANHAARSGLDPRRLARIISLTELEIRTRRQQMVAGGVAAGVHELTIPLESRIANSDPSNN